MLTHRGAQNRGDSVILIVKLKADGSREEDDRDADYLIY